MVLQTRTDEKVTGPHASAVVTFVADEHTRWDGAESLFVGVTAGYQASPLTTKPPIAIPIYVAGPLPALRVYSDLFHKSPIDNALVLFHQFLQSANRDSGACQDAAGLDLLFLKQLVFVRRLGELALVDTRRGDDVLGLAALGKRLELAVDRTEVAHAVQLVEDQPAGQRGDELNLAVLIAAVEFGQLALDALVQREALNEGAGLLCVVQGGGDLGGP
jgi:hypothetical protein